MKRHSVEVLLLFIFYQSLEEPQSWQKGHQKVKNIKKVYDKSDKRHNWLGNKFSGEREEQIKYQNFVLTSLRFYNNLLASIPGERNSWGILDKS